MGGDLGSGESRAGVETDTVATGALVDLDLARVGLEALRGVLGRDAALDGVATLADRVLREAERGEARSGGNLDLGRDNVDTGDGLRDGVLDLNTGWGEVRSAFDLWGERQNINLRLISIK